MSSSLLDSHESSLPAPLIGHDLPTSDKERWWDDPLVGTLTSGIAHDMNNLLLVVLTCAQLIKRSVPAMHRVTELADRIETVAEQGADLTRGLMDLASGARLETRCVDLAAFLTQTGRLLHGILPGSVRLEIDTPAGLPILVAIDRLRLAQIVLNLAFNARDAMPNGGLLRIELSVPKKSAVAVMKVRDTGSGIPKAIINRVFDPFFTTKSNGKGTGLGLATVRRLVEEAGGRIHVRSTPELGTTFAITFPRDAPQPSPIA